MKSILVGLLIILCILALAGCKEPTNEEIYYEVQKNFNSMDSYECVADIVLYTQDLVSTYKSRHVYKMPDKYIIEVLDPPDSKGCTTIYNGNNAWFYHPQINQSMLIKNFNNSMEENTFIGYFYKTSLTGESAKLGSDTIDDQDYLTILVEIPGNNNYRKSEKIWIHKKNLIPYKLSIFDNKGNITVEVEYSSFEYNISLDKKEFSIKEDKSDSSIE